eukprot:366514-Chlamydomonas_euryale.AAC.3
MTCNQRSTCGACHATTAAHVPCNRGTTCAARHANTALHARACHVVIAAHATCKYTAPCDVPRSHCSTCNMQVHGAM